MNEVSCIRLITFNSQVILWIFLYKVTKHSMASSIPLVYLLYS